MSLVLWARVRPGLSLGQMSDALTIPNCWMQKCHSDYLTASQVARAERRVSLFVTGVGHFGTQPEVPVYLLVSAMCRVSAPLCD